MSYRHPREFLYLGKTRMVEVQVILHWSYNGHGGKAEHLAVAMHEKETDRFDLGDYIWFDGNYSCDCNRSNLIGLTRESHPELFYEDGHDPRCGDKIFITRVESLDPEVASLEGETVE